MNEVDLSAFTDLFKEVYTKCFSQPLETPLSEPESRHLSNEIEEKTGLIIGWKSIKNYSFFILDESSNRKVNPSLATLDTLARYALNAPRTSETQRKRNETHYPYWFQYKEPYTKSHPIAAPERKRKTKVIALSVLFFFLLTILAFLHFQQPKPQTIVEDFSSVEENDLYNNGWILQSKDSLWWNKRRENAGHLTLFTLQGDNWPKTGETPRIQNLLLQKIQHDCFSAEVHLSSFVPQENWQQAGLLLLEDTTFTGKSIRLSLSYNDFFGGYPQPGEILIQAIASYGKAYSTLEEMVHQPLFTLSSEQEKQLAANNLQYSAVRIEKQGNTFRFLYSASDRENFSFKELTAYEFDMQPKFAGIFALKGFVDSTAVVPVGVEFFRLEGRECK